MLKKKTRYRYFAYGSNMLRRRLEDRVGRVKRIGNSSVENFELQFSCATNKISCSFADIVPKEGSRVHGVVYALTKRQLKILDYHEGLYDRHLLPVGGIPTIVYLSFVHVKDCSVPPTINYMRLLLAGYKENGLERSYLRLREKIYKHFGLHLDA